MQIVESRLPRVLWRKMPHLLSLPYPSLSIISLFYWLPLVVVVFRFRKFAIRSLRAPTWHVQLPSLWQSVVIIDLPKELLVCRIRFGFPRPRSISTRHLRTHTRCVHPLMDPPCEIITSLFESRGALPNIVYVDWCPVMLLSSYFCFNHT